MSWAYSEKFSRSVKFKLEIRKIKYFVMKITSKIICFMQETEASAKFSRWKLTSAWKLTSQRFHLIFNSCIGGKSFSVFPFLPSRKKKVSLWLWPALNISLCDENTNTYSWQKVFIWLFNLCFTRNFSYSSHMHEELCLYFAAKYFMSENIFHLERGTNIFGILEVT